MIDHLRELESEQLFDHFQIYQRDRTYIYKSETNEGFEAEVLQECLFGKWSKVEEEMIKEVKSSLKKFNEIRDSNPFRIYVLKITLKGLNYGGRYQ